MNIDLGDVGVILASILTLAGVLFTARQAGKSIQAQEQTKQDHSAQQLYSEYVDDIREDLSILKEEHKETQHELRTTHDELVAERESRLACERHREQQDFEMTQMKIRLDHLEDKVARYYEAFGPDPRGFEFRWSDANPNQLSLLEDYPSETED